MPLNDFSLSGIFFCGMDLNPKKWSVNLDCSGQFVVGSDRGTNLHGQQFT
jgi:hypothetical protein